MATQEDLEKIKELIAKVFEELLEAKELMDEVADWDTPEEWLRNNQPTRVPVALGNLAISYYHTNQKDKTELLLDELKQRSKETPVGSSSYFIANTYAQMGKIDFAFEWLENAYNDHEVEMIWLKVDPPFDPLRSDPRWQVMLDKVGFPE